MKIKIATKKDIEKLIDVYSEWSNFKNILPSNMVAISTHDSLIKYFDGSDKTRTYLLVSNENNNPMGACYIDTSFLGLNNIRLGYMMVKEEYRSQGVGSKLVKETIKFANENKVKKICLWTQEELKPAIRLYEKMGFTLEARLPKHFCDKDTLQFGLIL